MFEAMFQRESVPVLDAGLAFAQQRQNAIMNNIANVETPRYKRQELPDEEFFSMMKEAIEERETVHPNIFQMRPTINISVGMDGKYPMVNALPGKDPGPERHDENNVVIEKEMSDLAKNSIYIEALQKMIKKKYTMLKAAASERVA